MKIPPWAVGVLGLVVTGSGAVGVGVGRTTAESPAAIVATLESQNKQLERLENKVESLREDLGTAGKDRWTRTHMDDWLRSDFREEKRRITKLEERLAELLEARR